ncbi:hypothetical protein [Bacteroides salyersiae]|uniref:hypothetical protein n=1 Tax=Bacteroides salyersiae TaxID=291644 RepID=UPI001897C2B6|nr:hypothetical protein [Bacteroides salyersiae]
MKSYSDFYTVRVYDDTWGFHISPEIGMVVYPFNLYQLGLNVSGYYSYSTNHSSILHYDMNGINNLGFRLGLVF